VPIQRYVQKLQYKDASLTFQITFTILQACIRRCLQVSEECGALSSSDGEDGSEKSALKAEKIGLSEWLSPLRLVLSVSLLLAATLSPSPFMAPALLADSHGFFVSSVGN